MIRLIVKQLWANRRANGWIMAGLILVTFFLWRVIDPMFVLIANKAIPEGYDTDQTFLLTLDSYPDTHSRYNEKEATDSAMKVNFFRILEEVKQYPGVECAAVISGNYPFALGYNGAMLYRDTLSLHVQTMSPYRYGEYFRVFRIADAYTGTWEGLDEKLQAPGQFIITRGVEKLLFGGESAVGKTFSFGREEEFIVAAVVNDFKATSMGQPRPLFFHTEDDLYLSGSYTKIAFRIRDDLSTTRFSEEFQRDMKPRFFIGNYYFLKLQEFDRLRSRSEYLTGATHTLRLQTGLTFFFLISVFLGVSGTFWIRSNSRRSEIGLRMALGSTRRKIRESFLVESWLLTTIAFIIALLGVLQNVWFAGFAYADRAIHPDTMNSGYVQNQPIFHFLIVSAIVYFLMTGITLFATWIPANRAAATLPAEALRDE